MREDRGLKVAALLVNWRDAAGTAAAARSVRDDDAATEIVVVDNSDDDAHWQALREALPEGARAVRAEGNLGFGRGCNLAMRHTDAPLLMLVNPDARLRPGCAGALRAAMAAEPRLAAVAPRQFLDDACAWMLPPAWLPTALRAWVAERTMREPALRPRWARAARAESLRCWRADAPLRQRALSGAVMMVRRAALEASRTLPGELFDPRYFMYFEDADLCLRLRREGWRLALAPDARAVHRWRNAPHKAALMQQGMQAYFATHFGAGDPWQARREALAGQPPGPPWDPQAQPLAGTTLRVDAGEAHDWCVEVSPHPNLWPAVGCLGRGPATLELGEVLEAIAGGAQAWVRLSGVADEPLADARLWRWQAPAGN
jgi:GT2 family glycosyltransferase